jgi:carboxylate-amine ligase
LRKGPRKLHILEGFGIELEYMIVDRESLDILPVSDEVLRAMSGRYSNEYRSGSFGWSNELVLHVMELKNLEPVTSMDGLLPAFEEGICRINSLLSKKGGRLMPTGMHPLMDPSKETFLWSHRYRKIYETYDRIFGCRSHGWANIQSIHLNISFSGDEEFRRLHSGVRLILPLMPALTASSPVVEGKITGALDNRLLYYMQNQKKIPSIAGGIIPESVGSRIEYERRILNRIYLDISAFDPEGTLKHEWLNSRGAIPRFERSAMEIRISDIQECPLADLAVAAMCICALRALVSGKWSDIEDQEKIDTRSLRSILGDTVRFGEGAVIDDGMYLGLFGFDGKKVTASEFLGFIADNVICPDLMDKELRNAFRTILEHGTLATRILGALGKNPEEKRLKSVYRRLCDCLEKGELFLE